MSVQASVRQWEWLDQVPHIVWMATRDGRVDYVNSQAARYTGTPVEELLAGHWSPLEHQGTWADVTRTGQPFYAEQRLRGVGGQLRWHALRGVPVRDAEGGIVLWLGTATDIDDQKQLDQEQRDAEADRLRAELEDARDAALHALEAKSQFLANTSHELRTPLTAIMGMTDLLLRTELDGQQRDMAGAVKRSAERLLGIVVAILDVSAATNGNLTLELCAVDIRPLVEDVTAFVHPSARAKGLDLAWTVDDDTPSTVHADPARLRQMLLHLAENAVKFTDRGRVAIRVGRPEGVEIPSVRFMVVDSGIGVPPRDQWRLFRVFSQIDPTDTRRFGGNGLGLALVAQLADAMGGVVGVASSPGRGSTFWFDIPVAPRDRIRP